MIKHFLLSTALVTTLIATDEQPTQTSQTVFEPLVTESDVILDFFGPLKERVLIKRHLQDLTPQQKATFLKAFEGIDPANVDEFMEIAHPFLNAIPIFPGKVAFVKAAKTVQKEIAAAYFKAAKPLFAGLDGGFLGLINASKDTPLKGTTLTLSTAAMLASPFMQGLNGSERGKFFSMIVMAVETGRGIRSCRQLI